MPDTLGAVEALAAAAREDSPDGFGLFYTLVRNAKPPIHAIEEWIPEFYRAKGLNKGIVDDAFRGSTKTTTLTVFIAHQQGLHPEGSSLIVKGTEESASRAGDDLAAIIEHNPYWKLVFPTVVPDKVRGWSANGYCVKRSDIEYGEWTRRLITPQDPSIACFSYKASTILGMHPSTVLALDDILNRENTASAREMATVEQAITSTIWPTRSPHNPLTMIVGTPWKENDPVRKIIATGEYIHLSTPAIRDGVPVWPEGFGIEAIEKAKREDVSGGVEFARMYLLDLEAAKGIHLRSDWLHEYPAEEIKQNWPVVIGCDYASTADKLRDTERDYFALAVGRLIPGGGVVLVDGFRGHVSQGEAEQLTRAWAGKYPALALVAIEAIGKGEEFYHLMLRNSRIPLFPAQTGRKSKGDRFEMQLAPLFQSSRVWITTEQSEFLTAFKNEWISWPNGTHDDCLDAVYYMTIAATNTGNLAPQESFDQPRAWYEHAKKESIWREFGGRGA